jgi:hypothetical protein
VNVGGEVRTFNPRTGQLGPSLGPTGEQALLSPAKVAQMREISAPQPGVGVTPEAEAQQLRAKGFMRGPDNTLVPIPGGEQDPARNPLGTGETAKAAQVLRGLYPAIESGTATPEQTVMFRQALDMYTQERIDPSGARVPGLPVPPEIRRAAERLNAPPQQQGAAPPPGSPPQQQRETALSGSQRDIRPPVVTPQDRERWSVMETEAGRVTDAIKLFRDTSTAAGGLTAFNSYIGNTRAPEGVKLTAAYNVLKTALRSPAFLNTGVLQPAENNMIDKMLLSPESFRGAVASAGGVSELLNTLEGFVQQGLERQRRVAQGQGYVAPQQGSAPRLRFNPATGAIE